MKVRKVFKYATGEPIPKDAVYLATVTNGTMPEVAGNYSRDYKFVWHYFLVEVEE